MTREDEIAERLKEGGYHGDDADVAYLLTRVRQLEGRLPPTSVDVAAVRERLRYAEGGEDFTLTEIATLLTELDRLRAVAATLLSDNDSERVQAAVWETRRQTALECCNAVSPWFDACEAIRRRFGLEEQR